MWCGVVLGCFIEFYGVFLVLSVFGCFKEVFWSLSCYFWVAIGLFKYVWKFMEVLEYFSVKKSF